MSILLRGDVMDKKLEAGKLKLSSKIFNSIKGRKRSCNSKEIDIYDLFGNFIDTVKNARVAENKYGIPFRNVSQVCNGLKRQSHGYICRFHGDDFDKYEILRKDGKQCALR